MAGPFVEDLLQEDSMPLDPQVREYLDKMASLKLPSFHTMPPADSRRMFGAIRAMGGTPQPVGSVRDHRLGGSIPARAYTPKVSEAGPRPALVFYHGGGWVLGNLETIDGLCRRLANASGCVVVSVDYRLSPEAKFPAALDDCHQATRAVAAEAGSFGVDPGRIAVGGDSAGGNLAAAVAIRARDRGDLALAFQLLIYPIADFAFDTPSYLENAEGFGLTREAMIWYWDQYLARPEDGASPLASPLRAADLAGLPPALVVTAEYDVLRDEGEAYAARLREAGVAVEVRRYPGQIHGFLQLADTFPSARDAVADAGRALRAALAG